MQQIISSPGKGKWKNDIVNKSNVVIKPKIIVVPILRNVEETMAGITNRKEKGLKIPLSNKEEHLIVSNRLEGKELHKNLLVD